MTPQSKDTPLMSVSNWLTERNKLTQLLYDNPYDLIFYLERAISYNQLGYHDLAAGDAYRALLLTDEVEDEVEEYHAEAEERLKVHLAHYDDTEKYGREDYYYWRRCTCLGEALPPTSVMKDFDDIFEKDGKGEEAKSTDAEKSGLQRLLKSKRHDCYITLTWSLYRSGCLRSALEYCLRGLTAYPDSTTLDRIRVQILDAGRKKRIQDDDGAEELDVKHLPDQGFARREVYPWNTHEPDRFSSETLDFLNEELVKVAPKCEVRATDLPVLSISTSNDDDDDGTSTSSTTSKQLGLYARAEIAAGEIFLREKSVLTASNRLHDPICDACTAILPTTTTPIACPNCTDTLFCTEDCLSLAQENYHAASCAIDSLDAAIARDVPAKESTEALYILLLARALSMSITRNIHPLDLKEIKYTWGDFSTTTTTTPTTAANQTQTQTQSLPFSLSTTITTPLHILTALNINIYTSLSSLCEPWILQTIYAKLRSTASARISSSSSSSSMTLSSNVPNTAALHPLWCLANHDCDPNVTWGWDEKDGEMRFWCRAGVVKKGEELRSHYCDIRLGWRGRREWMIGCLGGWCRCGRCLREEMEEMEKERERERDKEINGVGKC